MSSAHFSLYAAIMAYLNIDLTGFRVVIEALNRKVFCITALVRLGASFFNVSILHPPRLSLMVPPITAFFGLAKTIPPIPVFETEGLSSEHAKEKEWNAKHRPTFVDRGGIGGSPAGEYAARMREMVCLCPHLLAIFLWNNDLTV